MMVSKCPLDGVVDEHGRLLIGIMYSALTSAPAIDFDLARMTMSGVRGSYSISIVLWNTQVSSAKLSSPQAAIQQAPKHGIRTAQKS